MSEALVPFKLWYGIVASGTGAATITDLPFTPDFVLWETGADTNDNAKSFTATSTTLTLTGRSTTTATTIHYIVANV